MAALKTPALPELGPQEKALVAAIGDQIATKTPKANWTDMSMFEAPESTFSSGCKVVGAVAAIGAAVGVGYMIYKNRQSPVSV